MITTAKNSTSTNGTAAIDRELQLIAARVRLLLYRHIAWVENRSSSAELAWQDPWQERAARAAWVEQDERGRELAANLGLTDAALARGASRMRRLEATFALDARESEVLQICAALAIAPELAGALTAATGRAVVTEPALDTVCGYLGRRVLTPQSPLVRWQLVHRIPLGGGEHDAIAIDPTVHDWLTGRYVIDEALIAVTRPIEPVEPLTHWPADALATRITERWQTESDPHFAITIKGPLGSGRRSFAATVAHRLGMGLLVVEADGIDDANWTRVVRLAHRHAFLTGNALAFCGDSLARRSCELAGGFPLVFACVEPGFAKAATPHAIDIPVDLPPTTNDDRAALWRRLVPAASTWDATAVDDLARRHHTTPGDIAQAARHGVTTASAAITAVRERTRGRLGELAQRLECPFEWGDLVLPTTIVDILRDYEFEARERARLWEQPGLRRLFPQGRGLFALFTGAPGTGKTMAAQVIAASLGVDLFRVSLSEVVSKYVGETAKNLQRILVRAEHIDAVLLFDEADALFGKRTEIRDAHDRYANTDTNHLLQAIESFGGVAILASNKKANIDNAFLRRLRYVVEFPQPDIAERLELWRRVVDVVCASRPTDAVTSVLPTLASSVELSGAQIKLSVLAATFAARREDATLGAAHLVRGIERELAKDGRSLTARDRERLLADAR